MIIKIKTNFCGQPELDLEMPTLKKVLIELSERIKFPILNPTNEEVSDDFKVYLNGVEYEGLPRRIDTELKDGDNVEVTIIVLAGG